MWWNNQEERGTSTSFISFCLELLMTHSVSHQNNAAKIENIHLGFFFNCLMMKRLRLKNKEFLNYCKILPIQTIFFFFSWPKPQIRTVWSNFWSHCTHTSPLTGSNELNLTVAESLLLPMQWLTWASHTHPLILFQCWFECFHWPLILSIYLLSCHLEAPLCNSSC